MFKKLDYRKFDRIALASFLISIFLFRTPNFYLIPGIENAFFTTQSVARVLMFSVFAYKILELFIHSKSITLSRSNTPLVLLILVFFALQSFSIFDALNTNAFLNRYKDVLLSVIAMFCFYFFQKQLKLILIALILPVIVNFIFEFLIMFETNFFLDFISPFVYQKYSVLLLANISRARLYVPAFDEIIIPFLFLFFFITKEKIKWLHLAIMIGIGFFSLASNFRSNVLMLLVAVTGSSVIFASTGIKKIAIIISSLLIIAFAVNAMLVNFIGYSFFNRLTFQSENQDISPIESRLTQLSLAAEMGASSIFGVGLGNYYDNLPTPRYALTPASARAVETQNAEEYIHNIFGTVLAESGYLSLLIFTAIVLLFIKNDIPIFLKGTNAQKTCVVAFWTIFSYGLLNPPVSATFQVLFWGLRGLLFIQPANRKSSESTP